MSGHTNSFFVDVGPSNRNLSSFSKPTTTWYPPTDYPIGLNCLDFGFARDIRVTSYFDNVKFNETDQAFDATINLDVGEENDMTAAGCQWFDNFKHDSNFQHGKLTLKPNRLYHHGTPMHVNKREHLIENISFPREFGSQPMVVVWLSGFDVSHTGNWCFGVNAIDITSRGFKILGEVWSTTKLNSMEATWIAYPASRPNIDSGRFDTVGVQGRDAAKQENSLKIKFEKNFEWLPRVYFALNKIDSLNNGKCNLQLKAYITDMTTKGMTAHLDSWGNSKQYSSGQWIAIQDY